MTDKAGLYIHIPFCKKKCAYCDFYSVIPMFDLKREYLNALMGEIKKWGGKFFDRPIDSIYIGGGTPSLLGEAIKPLMETVYKSFNVQSGAEITAEANPEDTDFLEYAYKSGINRISVGAQTFFDSVLKALGRRHTADDTVAFLEKARETGIDNISVDIMLALPGGNVQKDIERVIKLSPEHISAYILKREERTKFWKTNIPLPDDETAADEYLTACAMLEEAGYEHYEISNFAKNGFYGKHNLKYWQDREYLGIGPAAHSFIEGRRFYYPRDIKEFINAPQTVFDSFGGSKEEKMMLALRLKSGINLKECYNEIPEEITNKAKRLKGAGLIDGVFPKIHLTDRGMLVSNSIITELII